MNLDPVIHALARLPGERPRTWLSLSGQGRKAFKAYLKDL
jgi:hypothetical protein